MIPGPEVLLVLAAMYGNVALMFWPIAFTAWLGITGILYAINLLLTALVMGYEGQVVRMTQLARPATVALLFTLVELGALSALSDGSVRLVSCVLEYLEPPVRWAE